jgi:paraquat-inducible protein B
VTRDEEGAEFQLLAENLGSNSPGAPIFFRDIPVGRILNTTLQEDGTGVAMDIFIEAPHHLRIRDTSRFWQVGGFEISMGAEGLDVKMESLASLISGGIAFDTPATAGGSMALLLILPLQQEGPMNQANRVPFLKFLKILPALKKRRMS